MSLKTSFLDLKESFAALPRNAEKCGVLLTQLKRDLLEEGVLLPQYHLSTDVLVVAREIFEIGALWSIHTQDFPSFDRYLSQVFTFYTDYVHLPASQLEYRIWGLHLIRLLTQNRIAEFHIAVESLPGAAIDSPYIAHSMSLERWLMEGSYAKVWGMCVKPPSVEYQYFLNTLVGTTREEVASCAETAYRKLTLTDATTMLFFASRSELLGFGQERGWELNLTEDTITFAKEGGDTIYIPKQQIIASSLLYARALEHIV
ncbi:SAC3/GANP/Nin1/mts3/eIF-3 p25 family-domain-containing protein [Mycena leptocephala]|nr:SAC3/GANP/Nin1/mts3/eIF-3 p25 family-domain-containing protein [Mycena leptocephala]